MLEGGWAGCEPHKVVIGSSSSPVTIMLAVAGKIWCGCQNSIHVLNTGTLKVEVREFKLFTQFFVYIKLLKI